MVVSPIIEVSNLSFAIDGKSILDDVSVTVHEGEYLSIVGPNGAGKTTLLKIVDRIYQGATGNITIAGRSLHDYHQKELAKLVSYVPQADGQNFPFTVHEFVMMGRYPHLTPFSTPTKEDKDAVTEALDMTESTQFSDRYLTTLSGGERQKVFIAAALSQGAKILLLDEPTTFLDPKHEAEINRLLANVNRKLGVTIISVTHNINSAVLISDRVMALNSGKVAFIGNVDDFMNNENLQKIYAKNFLFAPHPETGKNIIVPDRP